MAKRASNLRHYAEVSQAANERYLNALAAVPDPRPAYQLLRRGARPARRAGRSYRGFNPAAQKDIKLFAAVMRGEHAISGFRNKDIRARLMPAPINRLSHAGRPQRSAACSNASTPANSSPRFPIAAAGA
jgi:hypothetical protein